MIFKELNLLFNAEKLSVPKQVDGKIQKIFVVIFVLVFCYQNCEKKNILVIEKLLKFEAEGREFTNF